MKLKINLRIQYNMFLEIAASMVKHLSIAQPHQVLLVKLKEAMETI